MGHNFVSDLCTLRPKNTFKNLFKNKKPIT